MLSKKMRILYHIPSPETVYAARFIYEGYRDAFLDLGHKFIPLTSSNNLKKTLEKYKPDIFISALNDYYLKFLDLDLIKSYRKKGMVYFNQIGLWNLKVNQFGGQSIKSRKDYCALITKGLAGDIFFNYFQPDDPEMDGFTKTTGFPFYTVLLAANTKQYFYEKDQKLTSDISFVGSLLPDKKEFVKKHLLPLMKKYDVNVYGSDWSLKDKLLGYVQKAGQYFNIEPLKKLRRLKLSVDSERKIYSSSRISLNIHENHQRQNGKDFNERTFKIIACRGFEICDNVKVIRKYFSEKELIIAKNTQDWFEKIEYYLKNPQKRTPIIKAGYQKIIKYHTYKNRVEQLIAIARNHLHNQRGITTATNNLK